MVIFRKTLPLAVCVESPKTFGGTSFWQPVLKIRMNKASATENMMDFINPFKKAK
jgi:hypothetical protein